MTKIILIFHLAFSNHPDKLNAAERYARQVKLFKTEHGPHDPLDWPVILFKDVVPVLCLPDINSRIIFRVISFNGCLVCSFLINGILRRHAIVVDGVIKEAFDGQAAVWYLFHKRTL